MKFEFSIPAEESCLKCRFGALESTKNSEVPWIFRCLINKELFIPFRDGATKRNDQCPGILEDGEE